MDMPVKHPARSQVLQQPAEHLESRVAAIFLIVYAQWGRVRYQYVKKAPVLRAVHEQLRQHLSNIPLHLLLGVLERALVIAHRSFQPRHQEPLMLLDPHVKVGGSPGRAPWAACPVFYAARMIPTYEVEGLVQHTYYVFQVVIRQVTTANYEVDMAKFLPNRGAVDEIDDLIAEG
jgi:hypothetical protein